MPSEIFLLFLLFPGFLKQRLKKKREEEEILSQFVGIFLALNTYHSSNVISKMLAPLNFLAGSIPWSLF